MSMGHFTHLACLLAHTRALPYSHWMETGQGRQWLGRHHGRPSTSGTWAGGGRAGRQHEWEAGRDRKVGWSGCQAWVYLLPAARAVCSLGSGRTPPPCLCQCSFPSPGSAACHSCCPATPQCLPCCHCHMLPPSPLPTLHACPSCLPLGFPMPGSSHCESLPMAFLPLQKHACPLYYLFIWF